MDLYNLKDINALLARLGCHFSKSMGQNFLIAPWVPQEIAASSGAAPDCGVLEIGPGIGPLTRELARRADKVVSVELDRSLLPILAETLADCPNAEVCPGDILKTDIPALVQEKFAGLTPIACANLPYNITTPAITALIEAGCFSSITVMIQREVARRICAQLGTSDYGAFSVFCQYHTRPELLFDVPPECFLPAPKVTSSVLKMTPCPPPPSVDNEAHFFQVVRAAFAQRRKTLVNSLSSSLGPSFSKEELTKAVISCGLPENIRGERLSISDFAALSTALRVL
mgnify:FL=1